MPDLPPTAPHREPSGSIGPAYFRDLYEADPDPWRFASSPYEASKYAATLDALPLPRYRRALEVGCAIGVLTRQLATRCDRLVATDVAPAALAQARERCRAFGHVEIVEAAVPEQTPDGPFDMAVVSEVGYYLSAEALAQFERQLAERVSAGGHVVLVHWTGDTDYPLTADSVHGAFAGPDWQSVSEHREDTYRLDVVERV